MTFFSGLLKNWTLLVSRTNSSWVAFFSMSTFLTFGVLSYRFILIMKHCIYASIFSWPIRACHCRWMIASWWRKNWQHLRWRQVPRWTTLHLLLQEDGERIGSISNGKCKAEQLRIIEGEASLKWRKTRIFMKPIKFHTYIFKILKER